MDAEIAQSLGVSRSVNQVYKRFRQEGKLHEPGQTFNTVRTQYDPREVLPPEWVDLYDRVQEQMTNIDAKLDDMSRAQQERLKMAFGDIESKDREIQELSNLITQMIKGCEEFVRQIVKVAGNNDDNSIRINIQRVFALRLKDLTKRHQMIQRTYIDQMQRLVSVNEDPREIQPVEDFDFEQDFAADMAQQRNENLSVLVNNLSELGTVFKELQIMVVEQGTILDRIDYNLESAADQSEHAVAQLLIAQKKQKSGRATWWIMMLMVGITFFAMVLIFRIDDGSTWEKTPTNPNPPTYSSNTAGNIN